MIFFMVNKYFILKLQPITFFNKVNSDNNSSPLSESNNNNDGNNVENNEGNQPENGSNRKHNYVKVLVDDPFNNRDIILKVTKKQKGILYVFLVADLIFLSDGLIKFANSMFDEYTVFSAIALISYADGEKRYILAPQGLQVGASIVSGDAVAPELGNALMLKNIPLGTVVHNIEMQPGQGGKLARSAGSSAQLANKEERYGVLKMPSGELRKILINCYATVGVVSNSDHSLESKGKAGRNRWKGIRPRVRGVAMNPVDHPHGGGEGKTGEGRHPVDPWGNLTKGYRTRNNKRTQVFIVSRRKK